MFLLFFLYLRAVQSFEYLPYKPHQFSHKMIQDFRAHIEDIPHHVLVVYGSLYCSGTLIGSKIVLTAASGIVKHGNGKIYVKLGTSSMTGDGQFIPVLKSKIHEYFKYLSPVDNDIALLLLKIDVTFGPAVKKAIVVKPDKALRVGSTLVISGWGSTDQDPKFINKLVWTEMSVADPSDCHKMYGSLMTQSSFCAKLASKHHLSDNGGPAIYTDLVVGIMAMGRGPRTNDSQADFAILTNVSYFHKWIVVNVKQFLVNYCSLKDGKSEGERDSDRSEYEYNYSI